MLLTALKIFFVVFTMGFLSSLPFHYIASVGTLEGTNDGEVKTLKLKKTGKKLAVPFLEIQRFADGKIADTYIIYDGAVFAGQLGLQ